MAKANADYARLKRNAEVLAEGFTVLAERSMAEIRKLLKGHPEVVKIEQLIDHYAVDTRDELDAKAQVMRYDDLLAKQTEAAKTTAKN